MFFRGSDSLAHSKQMWHVQSVTFGVDGLLSVNRSSDVFLTSYNMEEDFETHFGVFGETRAKKVTFQRFFVPNIAPAKYTQTTVKRKREKSSHSVTHGRTDGVGFSLWDKHLDDRTKATRKVT